MNIDEVRDMNTPELYRALQDEERSLMNLRFRKVTRQLTNTNEMRDTRKTIARIMTVIRERQIVEQMEIDA